MVYRRYDCGICICVLLIEKDNWEYQLSSGIGDEEWQIHAGLSADTEVPAPGSSKAGDNC